MKTLKKLTALLLCAATVCALIAVPPASAAVVSSFPDISDPAVGQAVEVLRTLGVVEGSEGKFVPGGELTRAQFCKMAILVMGRGNEVSAYKNKTIFPDVTGHWARGYVNMAASVSVGGSGENSPGQRLMVGGGDGRFDPDRSIRYSEVVTVLLRILGYSDAANANWPAGAMTAGASLGLSAGLSGLGATDIITRGQAAVLFCNMLKTPVYGGAASSTYFESLGTVQKDMLLLSCNTTLNGQDGAVRFFSKDGEVVTRLAAANTPASFLQGKRGWALFDRDGRFLTFLPDQNSSSRTLITLSATAGSTCIITGTDGTRLTFSPSTPVWYDGEKHPYSEIYTKLDRVGVAVTACYAADGTVEYLYAGSETEQLNSARLGALAVKNPVIGNPFSSLTGSSYNFTVVKNGALASLSDIRQYDVGMYDDAANVLYVSDFRLSCTYQDARPNTYAPSQILVFGQWVPVLESAIDDVRQFQLGQTMSLLFTPDGRVAGAVKPFQAPSNAIGVVDAAKSSGTSVTVNLINAPSTLSSISGALYYGGDASYYLNNVVSVSSGGSGIISLSSVGSAGSGVLNVSGRTLGNRRLAANVAVYERSNGSIREIGLSSLTASTIPAHKIVFSHLNYANQVDVLVIAEATGDNYVYGRATMGTVSVDNGTDADGNALPASVYTTLSVLNPEHPTIMDPAVKAVYLNNNWNSYYMEGQFVGVSVTPNTMEGANLPYVANCITLMSVSGASMINFNLNSQRFVYGALDLPIADDVQCYNTRTGTWFGAYGSYDGATPMDRLYTCLAYSTSVTVYYDRSPSDGGKVRVVAAN